MLEICKDGDHSLQIVRGESSFVGGSIQDVMALAGHRNLATTQRYEEQVVEAKKYSYLLMGSFQHSPESFISATCGKPALSIENWSGIKSKSHRIAI